MTLREIEPGGALAEISTDASGQPGTLIGSLTSPATYQMDYAVTTFTASGIALDASTIYWVVLRASNGEYEPATLLMLLPAAVVFAWRKRRA